MGRLFKKNQEDAEDELREYDKRQTPRELPPVPQAKPQEEQMISEVEVNLSLLNKKLNYLIGLVENLDSD